jgi:hypothetical protein
MRPVEIKELLIRASGLTRAEARRLGESVARELLETPLTFNAPRAIRELAIQVKTGSRVPVDQLARTIAGQIRNSLS